jgi:anti-sigma-K factor RskA
MLDEEQDTLAGEYVLGTLSAEEREHAEALLSFDPGFEAAVRQWERRLGELNVMVEAVEPPTAVWEKIKGEVTSAAPASDSAPLEPAGEPQTSVPPGEPELHLPRDLDDPAMAAALATDLGPFPETAADQAPAATTDIEQAAPVAAPVAEPAAIRPGADVINLAARVRRWQRVSVVFGAVAALLALYVAAWQAAPELIPARLRPAGMAMKTADTPRAQQPDRLVAVLQPGPNAPAFLLTLDALTHTLVVRRVSATAEAGKSYELWLIASRGGAPQSLGLVGDEEFTQRTVPASFNADTLRNAVYAVSLEPAGGSKSGAPSGPVLFTGKAVESWPAAPPKT